MFSLAYGQWLSGIAMAVVLGLPWLSLLLSFPAMAAFRLTVQGPTAVPVGVEADLWLEGSSGYPMLPFKGRLCLKNCITGEVRRCQSHMGLPTEHCGGYLVTVDKARACDYLGLIAVPVKRKERKTVLIRPRPLVVRELPELERYLAKAWRPKFGGGFAENHELRLYRPGDSLNQVHWKLSAKTGKLTIREPMEPQRGLLLLTMTLRGTPEELDRKFGRLLWLGTRLTERELEFELRVLTGEGVQAFSISGQRGLEEAIDQLLCAPEAREGSIRDRDFAASWQYHIGGGTDEA